MSSKDRKLEILDRHPLSSRIKRLDDQYSDWIETYKAKCVGDAKEIVLMVTGGSAKFIEPIIGRPGLYYSRLTGVSWSETLFGLSVEESVEVFLYRLFTAEDKPLHPRAAKALKELAAVDRSLLSVKQKIALEGHRRWIERRDLKRSIILSCKEALADE